VQGGDVVISGVVKPILPENGGVSTPIPPKDRKAVNNPAGCEQQSATAWYVVRTKARSERLVASGLHDNHINAYMPIIPCSSRRHNPEHTTIGEPLFPGYVFVQLDPASPAMVRTRSYPGVSYLISQEGHPAAVPDEVVHAIRERVDAVWRRLHTGHEPFRPGERVRVVSGPMAGLDAIFERPVSGRQRCEVLLHLMNRVARVIIPVTALAAFQPVPLL